MKRKLSKLWKIIQEEGVKEGLQKVREKIASEIFSRFYIDDGTLENVIFVAGAGRSGTTWLAKMLADCFNYRVIFEPFWHLHCELDGQKDFFHHRYIPLEEKRRFKTEIETVLRGSYRNKKTNTYNRKIYYNGRVIKDICANLFLHVIKSNFPFIPIIFIVRHPCAVVLSRLEKSKWSTEWGRHAYIFFNQKALVRDIFQARGIDLPKPSDELEDHAISYCCENFIPLNVLGEGKYFYKVYYENLVLDTTNCLKNIIRYIYEESGLKPAKPLSNHIEGTIVMTDPKRVKEIKNNPVKHLLRWQHELKPSQIEKIQSIVNHFKLGHVSQEIMDLMN